MRELELQEVEAVSGGLFFQVLAAAVTLYQAADIARDFFRGYEDGYNR